MVNPFFATIFAIKVWCWISLDTCEERKLQ